MTTQEPLPPLPPLDQITYCSESGDPMLWMWFDAWRFTNGAWKQERPVDVVNSTVVMTESAFHGRFGNLPKLPDGAFTPPAGGSGAMGDSEITNQRRS